MKPFARFLVSTILPLAFALSARATAQYFAEGWWLNAWVLQDGGDRIVADSAALWSGGNVGPYPGPGYETPSATFNDGQKSRTVRLEQSAFGQMVAGPLGFPNADFTLKSDAFALLKSSAAYATALTLDGEMQKPEGAWDIRFPGVLNPATGEDYGATGQNYFEDKNRDAEARYRAALRINPFDADAARGLLLCSYQRMVPQTFAGNNALVVATTERLSADRPLDAEIALLEHSVLPFYQQAAVEILELSSRQPGASLLDGSHPFVPVASLAAQVARLRASYGRALTLEAEALGRLYRLKYLNQYRAPVLGQQPLAALLAELDGRIDALSQRLLLANVFPAVPGASSSDFDAVEFHVSRLRQLRESIEDGRISFVAAQVSAPGTATPPTDFSLREYSPEYVPFDARSSGGFTDSFDNLLTRARDQAERSKMDDVEALKVERDFDVNEFTLRQSLRSIRDRYYGELGELAGLVFDSDNQLVPDVVRCFLAPGDREQFYGYPEGTSKGRIYEQWKAITQAELELQAANTDLQNVVSNMRKKQEVADQIASNIENIAHLIKENGDKIAALDLEEGEANAAATRTIARLKAQSATRSGIVGAVAQVGPAAVTGNFAALAAAAPGIIATVDSVLTSYAVGDVEAGLARRLGEIQAQKTRIAAFERVQIQYQQRDELLLRTEEAMHALVLEAERLKLNILLAEQRLDMANRELHNLIARIRFLLQEYRSANELESANPLRSPDYRLVRDLITRDAEESFILAQEAAFLAVKAAQYRINGALRQTGINTLLKDVLAARRGNQLVLRLANARNEVDALFRTQGAHRPEPEERIISVRHFIVQNNFVVVTNAQGEFDRSQSVLETTLAGETSDAQWLKFLADHFVTDPSSPSRKMLEFQFSTSLSCLTCNGDNGDLFRSENPLFSPALFNALIQYDPRGTEGRPAYGVQVAIRGRGLVGINPNTSTTVTLRQEGASYVRSEAFDEDDEAINVWNLQPLTARVNASINGFGTEGAAQLHERSPANDRWRFQFREAEGDNNRRILGQLDKITDIEVRFFVSGFQSQQ